MQFPKSRDLSYWFLLAVIAVVVALLSWIILNMIGAGLGSKEALLSTFIGAFVTAGAGNKAAKQQETGPARVRVTDAQSLAAWISDNPLFTALMLSLFWHNFTMLTLVAILPNSVAFYAGKMTFKFYDGAWRASQGTEAS